jgi:hypothetical protein
MLMENTDMNSSYDNPGTGSHTSYGSQSGSAEYGSQYSPGGSGQHTESPGAAAVRWMTEHPFLCAAAVAAIIAIGPRRIMRTAVTGGTALSALTLRNQANLNMLTRLISTAANYMQHERTR